MKRTPDFSGWATRNGVKCDDGRTIMRDAFKGNDGQKVSLVYNHDHGNLYSVLGHAILHNTPEGVYADCYLNDTDQGKLAKQVVSHGDVVGLSIYANQVQENEKRDVFRGNIRELSLVLSGANPGAYIDTIIGHDGYELDNEMVITTVIEDGIYFEHSSDKDEDKEDNTVKKEDDVEKIEKSKESEKKDMANNGDKTIQEVIDSMNEEQQTVLYGLIGEIAKKTGYDDGEKDDDDKEGEAEKMKHNVFDNDHDGGVIEHATFSSIMDNAKRCGSFKEALENAYEDGTLAHTSAPIPTAGMETATGHQTYGFNDASMLFPEFKNLNNPPEWISRNMDWVSVVMNGVHHSPFSRIKSQYANITEDEARAKGYIKGNRKKEEVFTTLKRTTSPTTIYKKQKLDRDDIVDITDFDVVAWIRAEMRVMLDEEIARAILIGDGRLGSDEDKIPEDHIRPIATDVPLFNTQVMVTYEKDPDDDIASETRARKIIRSAIKNRKNYKGSGNPIFFTTEDYLTDMLLLEDGIGHKMYKTEAELATALRVSRIVTVEAMEGYTITVDSKAYPVIGVMVNLQDYNVGADKGGEINNFDDFDIDYNQYKYLIETRCSGALIKPFSALTFLEDARDPS